MHFPVAAGDDQEVSEGRWAEGKQPFDLDVIYPSMGRSSQALCCPSLVFPCRIVEFLWGFLIICSIRTPSPVYLRTPSPNSGILDCTAESQLWFCPTPLTS